MKVHELDTPAVVIDLDIAERNIRRLADYTAEHGLNLRPHTKTHKIPDFAKKQVEAGAVGITVAKPGEAEVMAAAGLDDILIAYPVLGAEKVRRVQALTDRAKITVALDSLEAATALANTNIGVLVEFDTGFHRCGLPITRESVELAKRIACMPGIRWEGILFYPGHIKGTAATREAAVDRDNEQLEKLYSLLDEAGMHPNVVSGGNTPAMYLSHLFKGITEIRPGTYIFNDKNTVCAETVTYDDCAVSVLARVISNAVPGRAMIDAGSKTLSGDRLGTGDQRGFGYIVEHPDIEIEGMSEEHGHLKLGSNQLRVGELLRIIPNHVCTCMNMHDVVWGARGGEVVQEWRVEGRGKVR